MPDLLASVTAAMADRYEIQRELGRGGMATVWLARDLRHQRLVAVKVLHTELAATVGAERFLREIEIAAQLHHPHILPLYDSGECHPERSESGHGETPGFLYYVMPYVEGESLRARLVREKQLPIDDALRIAGETADALAYAHAKGVVHRDIKPENILLESGHAVVADFGIARAVTVAGGERLTSTGLTLGTPAYMSPEPAVGERDLDGRSDLYSLDCVLYEMLAGEPPISGSSVPVLLARKSTGSPPAVRALRAAVSPEVERVVTRAMAVLPADRFRTVQEFAEALSAAAAIPRGDVAPGRAAAGPRRRVALFASVGAVVVLAAAVVLWRTVGAGSRAGASAGAVDRVVVLPYHNETGDPALDPVGRMVAEWITEGLAQTGEVPVVPTLIVLQTLDGIAKGAAPRGGRPPVQQLARLTDSRIAVTGSYYKRGDALEFHSEVLDIASSKPLAAIPPIRARASDPGPAIDTVRLRVMGVLATRLSRTVGWEVPASVQPPGYEAYRVYTEGMERWVAGDYPAAATRFEQAFALDSTYLRSLLLGAAAYNNYGNRAMADSVLRFLRPRRERLSPYDRHRLDFLAASVRGDLAAELASSRAAADLVPLGTARYALLVALVRVNRPREARQQIEAVWGMPGGAETLAAYYAIWGVRCEILHLLGEHAAELEVARQGRTRLPGSLWTQQYEGVALAALGRTDEIRRLMDEVLATAPQPQVTPASVLSYIGQELRAHGHGPAAADVASRALAWSDAQPAKLRATPAARALRVRLLSLREQWADAAAIAALASEGRGPGDVADQLGMRGVLAARRGQPDSARAIAEQLERLRLPYLNGRHTRWRARIAALLGEKDAAVALLQQAYREGVGFGIWLHADMDLESLRGYAPFRELLRAKG
jgi:tetratricopeptide (TPR) repeat protein